MGTGSTIATGGTGGTSRPITAALTSILAGSLVGARGARSVSDEFAKTADSSAGARAVVRRFPFGAAGPQSVQSPQCNHRRGKEIRKYETGLPYASSATRPI